MPKRALAQKRPYLMLSLLAAFAYYYLQASEIPEIYLVPIKGSACSFLALYGWLRHGSKSARLLATAMAAAAAADMAMEMDIRFGAALFFVFHCIMIALFLGHRGKPLEGRDSMIFIALLLVTPALAYLLVEVPGAAMPAAIYSLALGAMAASAWASDFPRWKVGAGAILFVASDLLIFAGMGPLSGSAVPQYLVWPVYYLGQFLLTVGIVTTLGKRDPELRVVQGGAV